MPRIRGLRGMGGVGSGVGAHTDYATDIRIKRYGRCGMCEKCGKCGERGKCGEIESCLLKMLTFCSSKGRKPGTFAKHQKGYNLYVSIL
ncbi:MAG: hypothetical protein F6K40_07660 [Okeania sp. SIO3I5]|uniref:hypothetical protein n=1 Tax=Okeania sp. SIO3I5 TaxID=2607805 RepID=UPI0013BE3C70|nr:hypothetical protein [Okeania sp. SIO3I5]NEQ36168.1 hypothetical protein [Okeania sp. SIO3I5]